jgi:glucokinase
MASPVLLGLDFGGSKMAAAVTDAAGVRLGYGVTDVEPEVGAEQTLQRGLDAAHRLLDEVAADRPLVAVGACTFGIPHEDRVELAPNVSGWEALPFGRQVRQAFPTAAVTLATDVKAAALAEIEDGALTGCDVGLYINLGSGLAVALVVGGHVVAGHRGAAGEIGYNLRHSGAGADGLRLEDAVSGKALEAAAVRLVGGPDVGALFERAAQDPAARDVCEAFAGELSFHLVNLAIALDPERVVVGGGLARAWHAVQPRLAAALAAAVPFPPTLALAAHPYDAPLLGALALARASLPDLFSITAVLNEGAPA